MNTRRDIVFGNKPQFQFKQDLGPKQPQKEQIPSESKSELGFKKNSNSIDIAETSNNQTDTQELKNKSTQNLFRKLDHSEYLYNQIFLKNK